MEIPKKILGSNYIFLNNNIYILKNGIKTLKNPLMLKGKFLFFTH